MANEAVKPEKGTASGGAATRGPLGYGRGVVMLAGGLAIGLMPVLVGGSIAMASAMSTPPAVSASQDPTEDGSTTDPDRDSGQDDGTNDGSSQDGADGTAGKDGAEGENDKGEASKPENSVEYKSDTTHMVEWGETLTSISMRYGVSVDMLAEYNHIRDVNLIYADSAMLVPYSQLKIPVED